MSKKICRKKDNFITSTLTQIRKIGYISAFGV